MTKRATNSFTGGMPPSMKIASVKPGRKIYDAAQNIPATSPNGTLALNKLLSFTCRAQPDRPSMIAKPAAAIQRSGTKCVTAMKARNPANMPPPNRAQSGFSASWPSSLARQLSEKAIAAAPAKSNPQTVSLNSISPWLIHPTNSGPATPPSARAVQIFCVSPSLRASRCPGRAKRNVAAIAAQSAKGRSCSKAANNRMTTSPSAASVAGINLGSRQPR